MGRRAGNAVHLALCLIGGALYFLFVIPRWWVLTGDFPASLATTGRIAAGVPIAAAAVPVALSLRRALQPDAAAVPELALRLRAWAAVLHVVAGVLIVLTAIAEIWLGLGTAGPWLFALYGAGGALAILAITSFYLSFTAEQPPGPPKPPKVKKEKKERKRRGRAGKEAAADGEDPIDESAGDTEEAADEPADATSSAAGPEIEPEDTDAADPVEEPAASDALLNKRPGGRRRHRLRR